MTPDMTVVSKHGFVSLVTSGIDVALASGRGGLPINRVVAAFFRARCRCDLLRQHIISVEIIENHQHRLDLQPVHETGWFIMVVVIVKRR